MEKTEKVWETPYLVVLSRGRPDESVLLHCKRIGNEGLTADATNTAQQGCDKGDDNNNCGACQARSGS
jgi:hypothetical protein